MTDNIIAKSQQDVNNNLKRNTCTSTGDFTVTTISANTR